MKFTIPEVEPEQILYDTVLDQYNCPFEGLEENSLKKAELLVEYATVLNLLKQYEIKVEKQEDHIRDLKNDVENRFTAPQAALQELPRAEIVWKSSPKWTIGCIVERFMIDHALHPMLKRQKLLNIAFTQIQAHYSKSLEEIPAIKIKEFEDKPPRYKGDSKTLQEELNRISLADHLHQRLLFRDEIVIMCALCRDNPLDQQAPYCCYLRNALDQMAKHIKQIHGINPQDYALTKETDVFGAKIQNIFLGMFYYLHFYCY